MADDDGVPRSGRGVGSVAEETARLLEALAGGTSGTRRTAPGQPTGAGGAKEATGAAEAGEAAEPAGSGEAAQPAGGGEAAQPAGGGEAAQPAASPSSAAEVCPTCGHASGGTHTAAREDVCRLCPVCQLVRAARAVRPEVLDRFADLAAAVTDALRDAAAARRSESADTASRPQRRGPTVERIVVTGDEHPHGGDTAHDEAEEAW